MIIARKQNVDSWVWKKGKVRDMSVRYEVIGMRIKITHVGFFRANYRCSTAAFRS
jgi:hypothetical protein